MQEGYKLDSHVGSIRSVHETSTRTQDPKVHNRNVVQDIIYLIGSCCNDGDGLPYRYEKLDNGEYGDVDQWSLGKEPAAHKSLREEAFVGANHYYLNSSKDPDKMRRLLEFVRYGPTVENCPSDEFNPTPIRSKQDIIQTLREVFSNGTYGTAYKNFSAVSISPDSAVRLSTQASLGRASLAERIINAAIQMVEVEIDNF